MPNLGNTLVRRMNRERSTGMPLGTVNENPYEKLPAVLEEGCWYRGPVIGFSLDQALVSLSPKHCKVPVYGCCKEVERGDTIIFEVTSTKGFMAYGEFREIFEKAERTEG